MSITLVARTHSTRPIVDLSPPNLVLSGETSSGKTELRRLAIRALINLSAATPGKKGSKLAIQIPSGQHILESMGNARTLENGNASRYGSYTELQFSDAGKLVGSKTLDYYLERSRLVAAGTGDGTFHIFYALVAGASAEERQHLLGSVSRLIKNVSYPDECPGFINEVLDNPLD